MTDSGTVCDRRCFIALVPAASLVPQLTALARALQAEFPQSRATASENFHVTLAFIGALSAPRAADVARNLQAITPAPFSWTLDRLGAFAEAGVAWAGGAAPGPLLQLTARCRALLDRLAIAYDHKPLVAHVTLLRNLSRRAHLERAIEPMSWPVTAPVLLSSHAGVRGVRYEQVMP